MALELVPVFKDRPAILRRDGVFIYVSVHDAAYLLRRSQWIEAQTRAHPDKGGSAKEFNFVRTGFHKWLQEERAWYRQWGLEPPERSAREPENLFRAVEREILVEVMRVVGNPSDAAKVLGISRVALWQKLRRRGIAVKFSAGRTGPVNLPYVLEWCLPELNDIQVDADAAERYRQISAAHALERKRRRRVTKRFELIAGRKCEYEKCRKPIPTARIRTARFCDARCWRAQRSLVRLRDRRSCAVG